MAQDLNDITPVSEILRHEWQDFDPVVYEKLGVYTTLFDITHNKPKDFFMSFDNIVIAKVETGWVRLEVNMQQVTLQPGHLFIVHKSSVGRVLDYSSDYTTRVAMANGELFAMATTGVEMELLHSIFSASSIELKNKHRLEAIDHIFQVFGNLSACSTMRHNREVAVMMMRGLIVLCSDELAEQGLLANGNEKQSSFSSADVFFRNFVALLDEHVKTEHEVSFYAERLKITPKYLNEMVRRKSQYKAKEVISGFLVGRIKSELLTSGKSIKTIAYEYNFSDQSSFGKFFKKETGMSPLMFRQSRGIKDEE